MASRTSLSQEQPMPFAPFDGRCRDVAKTETRTATLLRPSFGLPVGDYQFNELYCDESGCDCRRVFFAVTTAGSSQIQAVIAWGWEDLAFYKRWMGDDDPNMAREMQGPVLNLASPQSANAEGLLELACNLLLPDPAYVERIKRHYALFRAKIDGHVKKARKDARKKGRKK